MEDKIKLTPDVLDEHLSRENVKKEISECSAEHIGEQKKAVHSFVKWTFGIIIPVTGIALAIPGEKNVMIYIWAAVTLLIFIILIRYIFSFYSLYYKLDKIKSSFLDKSDEKLKMISRANNQDITSFTQTNEEKDNLFKERDNLSEQANSLISENEQLKENRSGLKDMIEKKDIEIKNLKIHCAELEANKQFMIMRFGEHLSSLPEEMISSIEKDIVDKERIGKITNSILLLVEENENE